MTKANVVKEEKACRTSFTDRVAQIALNLNEDFPATIASHCDVAPDKLSDIPFAGVLMALVIDGAARVRDSALYNALPSLARESCERYLLHRLVQQSFYSLFFQFSLFRAARRQFCATGAFESSASNLLYNQFVENMRASELAVFLQEYGELRICLERIIELWCTNTIELLERIEADKHLLAAVMPDRQSPAEIVDVRLFMSEPHSKGHSVACIEFSNGSVYYKPRDCSADVNYNKLVDWLVARGANLRAVHVIDRNGYGWFEEILKTPCQNQSQVQKFYENSGELLCLLHMLRAADNHCENVIAAADMPVLIDTECLMHPDLEDIFERMPKGTATGTMDSIFSTLLIAPNPDPNLPSVMPDLCALSAVDPTDMKIPFKLPILININTDAMQLALPERLGQAALVQLNSQVVLDGKVQQFKEFGNEIAQGFVSMYNLLLRSKAELMSVDSPLAGFKTQKVRTVARATMVYALLQILASRSHLTRTVGDRKKFLTEFLTAISGSDAERLQLMIETEVESMTVHFDIPYFSVDATALQFLNDGPTFKASCFDMMMKGVESFSQEKLHEHLEALESALSVPDRVA